MAGLFLQGFAMPNIFRRSYTLPIPADAELIDIKGVPSARVRHKGKTRTAPLTEDGRRMSIQSPSWYGWMNGKAVKLFNDAVASQQRLADLLRNQSAGKAASWIRLKSIANGRSPNIFLIGKPTLKAAARRKAIPTPQRLASNASSRGADSNVSGISPLPRSSNSLPTCAPMARRFAPSIGPKRNTPRPSLPRPLASTGLPSRR